MQETRLATHLLKVFGVSGAKGGRGAHLLEWPHDESQFLCLGDCVQAIISDVNTVCFHPKNRKVHGSLTHKPGSKLRKFS